MKGKFFATVIFLILGMTILFMIIPNPYNAKMNTNVVNKVFADDGDNGGGDDGDNGGGDDGGGSGDDGGGDNHNNKGGDNHKKGGESKSKKHKDVGNDKHISSNNGDQDLNGDNNDGGQKTTGDTIKRGTPHCNGIGCSGPGKRPNGDGGSGNSYDDKHKFGVSGDNWKNKDKDKDGNHDGGHDHDGGYDNHNDNHNGDNHNHNGDNHNKHHSHGNDHHHNHDHNYDNDKHYHNHNDNNYYYYYSNDYSDNHATVILQLDYHGSNSHDDIRLEIGNDFDTTINFAGEPEDLVVTGLDIDDDEEFSVCLENEDSGEVNCVDTHLRDQDEALYVDIRVPS